MLFSKFKELLAALHGIFSINQSYNFKRDLNALKLHLFSKFQFWPYMPYWLWAYQPTQEGGLRFLIFWAKNEEIKVPSWFISQMGLPLLSMATQSHFKWINNKIIILLFFFQKFHKIIILLFFVHKINILLFLALKTEHFMVLYFTK